MFSYVKMVLLQITHKGAITMDQNHSNTNEGKRKYKSHLTLAERGKIQALHEIGYSTRKIAAVVGCAHTTVYYELKRGIPVKRGKRGRNPHYKAQRAHEVYKKNRKRSKRKLKIYAVCCEPFIQWMCNQIRKHKWSIDACVGYARNKKLFPYEQIPCTKTIYNMLKKQLLPISVFDTPKILSRKKHKTNQRKNKRVLGKSIELRPDIDSTEFGHWEVDTVVGRRNGREAVIFTAVEKLTRNYIAIRISGRTSSGVEEAMNQLEDLYGTKLFSKVFKTITADNGAEFSTFSNFEKLGTKVYFAHPYSSWERAQNERHNGILREYVPKGQSIENYSAEDILNIADDINMRPRRILGYHCPAELYDHFLDEIYSMDNIS